MNKIEFNYAYPMPSSQKSLSQLHEHSNIQEKNSEAKYQNRVILALEGSESSFERNMLDGVSGENAAKPPIK